MHSYSLRNGSRKRNRQLTGGARAAPNRVGAPRLIKFPANTAGAKCESRWRRIPNIEFGRLGRPTLRESGINRNIYQYPEIRDVKFLNVDMMSTDPICVCSLNVARGQYRNETSLILVKIGPPSH